MTEHTRHRYHQLALVAARDVLRDHNADAAWATLRALAKIGAWGARA